MITRAIPTIPVIHRFIPFLFVLLYVIAAFYLFAPLKAHAAGFSFTDTSVHQTIDWFNAPYANDMATGTISGPIISVDFYVGASSGNNYRVSIQDIDTTAYLFHVVECGAGPSVTGVLHCDVSGVGAVASSTSRYRVYFEQGTGGAFGSFDVYGGPKPVGIDDCSIAGDPGGFCAGGNAIYMVVNAGSSNTQTRIDTVSPYNGEIIATTSLPWNYTTTGYTNSGDFQDGERLRVYVNRNTDNQSVGALTAFNSAFGNNTYIPINADGTFSVSTTTINNTFGVDRVGKYQMTQEIQVPGIGVHWWVFNFDITYNTLVATSTSFTVGTSTAIDNIVDAQAAALEPLLTSTGNALQGCQFSWYNSAIDFSLGSNLMNCIAGLSQYLFVPTNAQLQGAVEGIKNGALARAPWGYAVRIGQIFNASTTPTALPVWTAYVNTSATASTTFTFDMGDMLIGGAATLNSVTDPRSGKTLRDIAEPMVELFIAITFFIIVFHDLMAMGHRKKPPPSAK